MAAGEVQLIYLFSGLLAFGAVFLAFVPALHHAWTFAVSRRTFAVLLTVILGFGMASVLFVTYAVHDALYFIVFAIITVGVGMLSPFFLHRRALGGFEGYLWCVARRWVVEKS